MKSIQFFEEVELVRDKEGVRNINHFLGTFFMRIYSSMSKEGTSFVGGVKVKLCLE